MENRVLSLHLLLVAIATLLLGSISTSLQSSSPSPEVPLSLTPSPQPKPSSPPPFPPHPQQEEEQLLENIVSALATAGGFRHWANLLSAADPSPLISSATLFIPSDEALSHFPTSPLISFDPFLIPYHIIPQRLPFSDLQLFKPLTRLPTLLPSNSILITTNSNTPHSHNFSVDGSPITHPDLYVNSAVAVHGIKNVLDYSLYGAPAAGLSPPPPPPPVVITKGKGPGPAAAAETVRSYCGRTRNSGWVSWLQLLAPLAFAFKISQLWRPVNSSVLFST